MINSQQAFPYEIRMKIYFPQGRKLEVLDPRIPGSKEAG